MATSFENTPTNSPSNIEKFKQGQYSPTPEEEERARAVGGEDAVKALRQKMSRATDRLREKQFEEAIKELEEEFGR